PSSYPAGGNSYPTYPASSSSAVVTYPVQTYPAETPSSSAPGYPVSTPAPYPTESYPVTFTTSVGTVSAPGYPTSTPIPTAGAGRVAASFGIVGAALAAYLL
ncbi:hypothetical protein CIB48_g10140, partial [Xylaria polymorpha]